MFACAHMHPGLQRLEEDVGSTGTGATHGCEVLGWSSGRCWESNVGPPDEQSVLLTAGQSLHLPTRFKMALHSTASVYIKALIFEGF